MKTTVLDSLNQGLLIALSKDANVLLLGEDILDPYGGAFKVTRGCSSTYPDQVLTTPISEAGLTGVAAGMALRGLRPVLEIMFGDFVTLQADQLINHISKYRWMYNQRVEVPLVIRTPMGGRRGYGPTHSQTLEKFYMGVPGLSVIAPVNFSLDCKNGNPGLLLENTILNTHDPVLFVENKLQYLLPLLDRESLADFDVSVHYDPTDESEDYPIYTLNIQGAPAPKVTVTAYGYMAELVRQAQLKLAYEEEFFIELVIPTRLSPFALTPLFECAARTGRLLTVEEGTLSLGWGAEVIACTVQNVPSLKKSARLAARETPVPAATSLEKSTLPQLDDILNAIRKMDK